MLTGRKSSIGTSALQLTTAVGLGKTYEGRGVVLVAPSGNTAAVYVGTSNAVTADAADGTDGVAILPGATVRLNVTHPSGLWVISTAASQKLFWAAD